MTYENFIRLIKHPEKISEEDQAALREMIEKFPYFGVARMLYMKSLYVSNSIYFQQQLEKHSVYSPNRRKLYFFIHPEEKSNNELISKNRSHTTGSYFDMIKTFEKGEEKSSGSLQTLAEKLREARELQSSKHDKSAEIERNENLDSSPKEKTTNLDAEKEYHYLLLENDSKELIREKKYAEAIEILEKLNLINPKKSIYFADQIRFLKKITNN